MTLASEKARTGTPEEAFIRRALKRADLNALRIALFHQTQDPDLKEMDVVSFPLRGGAFEARVLAREHYKAVQDKAVAYLMDPDRDVRPNPSRAEAGTLMELFQGKTLDKRAMQFGFEDLGFERFSRDVTWNEKPTRGVLDSFHVTIVGAGISGIAASIQLRRLGINHTILEKRDGFGGTWHINDYPDARVDISTFLYQYKFEQNYPWKSFYASQQELTEYLDHIVKKYGVSDQIELNTELQSANWDERAKSWQLMIKRPDGSIETRDTNVVISAVGLFGTPKLPDIPGIAEYEGAMFHTTDWDHNFKAKDKRIAVIGTGSTGTQLMPVLAEQASQLTVYQRTPSWITPVDAYKAEVSDELRWLLDNMPGYSNWHVYSLHVADLQLQDFQDLDHAWIEKGGQVNEKNDRLRESLISYIATKCDGRPDLYEKLVPDYAPTARRLVIDNGFYDALLRDNVELDSAGIEKITQTGIRSEDGVERDFDLIVLGAGFQVSRYLWPVTYKGRDGVTLEELWETDGARAHLGINLPGFPNFFVIYGPNAQARSGSFHSWIEILVRYICGLIVQMIERDARSIEVKQSAFEAYNHRMDEAMKTTLWEKEGQGGYYVNEHGRSGVNMPWRIYDFFEFVCDSGLDEFELN